VPSRLLARPSHPPPSKQQARPKGTLLRLWVKGLVVVLRPVSVDPWVVLRKWIWIGWGLGVGAENVRCCALGALKQQQLG
jgi:hypothetical protein